MIQFTNAAYIGLIPMFFNQADERSAREQLHEAYAHGGGVNPFEGFELTFDYDDPHNSTIKYPGDPANKCMSYGKLRDEYILIFEHAWVCIFTDPSDPLITRCD